MQKGSALITVVIIMSTVFLIAALLIGYTVKDRKTVGVLHDELQAYYSAESGINLAVKHISGSAVLANKTFEINDNLFNDEKASVEVQIEIISQSGDGSGGQTGGSGQTGDGEGSGDGDGNGNSYGNKKPYFTTVPAEEIFIQAPISRIYLDDNNRFQGFPESSIQRVKHLQNNAIKDHKRLMINNIESQINDFEDSAIRCRNYDIDEIMDEIDKTGSSHVIIKADNLNLSKDVTLGSPDKAVTIIVDSLNVNSGVQNLIVNGNLIVLNNFNGNTAVNIKTNKVEGAHGNFYVTGSLNLNYSGVHEIQGTMYANSMELNNQIEVKIDRLIVNNSLNTNTGTVRITAVNDIIAGSVTHNTAAYITSANGDLIIHGNYNKNSSLDINVAGRIAVGGNITFNNGPANVLAGGKTTSLILPGEKGGSDPGDGGGDGDMAEVKIISTGFYGDCQHTIEKTIVFIKSGNNYLIDEIKSVKSTRG